MILLQSMKSVIEILWCNSLSFLDQSRGGNPNPAEQSWRFWALWCQASVDMKSTEGSSNHCTCSSCICDSLLSTTFCPNLQHHPSDFNPITCSYFHPTPPHPTAIPPPPASFPRTNLDANHHQTSRPIPSLPANHYEEKEEEDVAHFQSSLNHVKFDWK